MRLLSRSLAPVLLIALIGGCIDRPSHPRRPASSSDVPLPLPPEWVGRPPPSSAPLQVISPESVRVSYALPAALTSLPRGGALLAWAARDPAARYPQSVLAVRSLSPTGTLGATYLVGRSRGMVHDLALAIRGDEALIVWITSPGGIAAHIEAQRIRTDGARIGPPILLAAYHAKRALPDGASPTDPLGFVVRASSTTDGFLLAVRGPLIPCDGGMCPSIRWVEIVANNRIVPRGQVYHRGLRTPVWLLARTSDDWNAVVHLDASDAQQSIVVAGPGALSQLRPPAGASLMAAWMSSDTAGALFQHPRDDVAYVYELFQSVSGDAGTEPLRIDGARVICNDGVPAVELLHRHRRRIVSVDTPGGNTLAQWALSRYRTSQGIFSASAVATTGSGLAMAQTTGLVFARCQGTRLGPTVGIPWPEDDHGPRDP